MLFIFLNCDLIVFLVHILKKIWNICDHNEQDVSPESSIALYLSLVSVCVCVCGVCVVVCVVLLCGGVCVCVCCWGCMVSLAPPVGSFASCFPVFPPFL